MTALGSDAPSRPQWRTHWASTARRDDLSILQAANGYPRPELCRALFTGLPACPALESLIITSHLVNDLSPVGPLQLLLRPKFMLMSIAYQMALRDAEVLHKVLKLQDDDPSWERQSCRYIWRKLFLETRSDPDVCEPYLVYRRIRRMLFSQMPPGLRVVSRAATPQRSREAPR